VAQGVDSKFKLQYHKKKKKNPNKKGLVKSGLCLNYRTLPSMHKAVEKSFGEILVQGLGCSLVVEHFQRS
jgi:hypothetical protein